MENPADDSAFIEKYREPLEELAGESQRIINSGLDIKYLILFIILSMLPFIIILLIRTKQLKNGSVMDLINNNKRKKVAQEEIENFETAKATTTSGELDYKGSGKTTLLSIIAGLNEPTEGSIFLNGKDLKDMDLDEYRRDNVFMIFQAFQLFSLLTALENISFPMEYKGIPKEEAREKGKKVLNSIGIDGDKQSRYPSNLSGGEQQRVAIGRTLARGAKVILVDEPTGNLDDENSDRIIDILKELAHEHGFCVIIVTHDMEIAEASDHVWRIKDGTIENVK